MKKGFPSPGSKMPEWKDQITAQLAHLKLEPTREADIVEELVQHLEDRYQDLLSRDETQAEASRVALAELIDSELLSRELRRVERRVNSEPVVFGARRRNMLGDLVQDLRYGARLLFKSPGFTVVAVLTLALGIGANTAIFTLIDAILLKMLPVQHPEQLVEFGRLTRNGPLTGGFSYPAFEQFRDNNGSFSGVLTVSRTPLRTTGESEIEPVDGQYVSGNFFSLLGVGASIGRTIIPEDDRVSESVGSSVGSSVAVISYGLWQRRFGGDPSVIGEQIAVEGKPFTIIGVTPPEFFGLQVGSSPDFWIPIASEPLLRPKSWLRQGDFGWLSVVGRLKPGISSERANADLDVIFGQILDERSARIKDEHERQVLLSEKVSVASAGNGLSRLRQQFSKPLLILMAIVGLVLLIACANIANLLLARATSRRREVAVRLALGASRSRLMGQILTESVLLSFIGGFAGLLFAFWASRFLVVFMSSGQTPIVLNLKPDGSVLAFTTVVSLVTGALFGLAPAFSATRIDPGPTLKEHALAPGGGRSGGAFGRVLVVSQVALSLVLVVGAGLFAGSLRNLKTLDAGFNPNNVLFATLNPAKAGYKDARLAGFLRAGPRPGPSGSGGSFRQLVNVDANLRRRLGSYSNRATSYNSAVPSVAAPLDRVGLSVREGEYLLAVDGQEINASKEVYAYFERKGPPPIKVTVGPTPDGQGARTLTVYPIANEAGLRMANLAEANRRRVEEASGGKLAYIYIGNYGQGGIMDFIRGVTGYGDLPGLVIDQRYNGGGVTPDISDRMAATPSDLLLPLPRG